MKYKNCVVFYFAPLDDLVMKTREIILSKLCVCVWAMNESV